MKKIAASVGLVALGTSALQAADASALSAMQSTKPWNASITLRGFYDDNINGTRTDKQGSFGFEVNPSVGVGVAGEQTSARIGYSYSGKYFDNRPAGNSSNWDHTHIFDAAVQHAFSPRARLAVQDSFVIGQEPDVLRSGPTYISFQRISGDNIRNFGSIVFTADVTELLGFEVGYANGWYDYSDHGATTDVFGNVVASRSGALDRLEHSAHVDARFHFAPQTVGIVGYMYAQTDYIGDELIQGNIFAPPGSSFAPQSSDARNSRSHIGYLGLEHSFNPDLSGSIKVGAQYIYYPNDPNGSSSISPWAAASLKYAYAVDSRVDLGVTQARSTTDITGGPGTSVVSDADTTTAYISVTQRILPRLFGTVIGTFQYQTLNGGGTGIDDRSDRFYLLGLDLSYRFNQHLSANVGYNLDHLESELPGRNFTRNRVYIGGTAEY